MTKTVPSSRSQKSQVSDQTLDSLDVGRGTEKRRRRPLLRTVRVSLRGVLDAYAQAARCRGDVARRRFVAQVVKVCRVHRQEDLTTEVAENTERK